MAEGSLTELLNIRLGKKKLFQGTIKELLVDRRTPSKDAQVLIPGT